MVCRYMIERLHMSADEAITLFNTGRGHQQERDNYLQHLRSRGWVKEVGVTTGIGARSLTGEPGSS